MGQAALMAKNHLFSLPDQLWRVQMQEKLITKEILQSTVLVQELLRSWPTKVNGCPITPFQTGSECVISCKTSIFTGFGLTSCLWKMWYSYFGLLSFPAISLSLCHIGCIWWRTSVSVCVRNPPSAATPHWLRSLLNVLLWPDYSQSAFKYLSPRSISPSYSTPCSSQSAMLYCTMCRQNLQYKCKESHEVWIVVRWNSKARIPIDGEASRFCVCVFIVMLSFCISKAIVFTTGGEVIFSWWFSPENQDRESSYTFSMQWYECLQTESEGIYSWRGETSILVCCNAHSHPKLDGRCQPEARCPTKVGTIEKKFISSVFFNAFLIYGTLCGYVNCQLVSFMSASVGALCLGQLQCVGCLFFFRKRDCWDW